MPENFEVSFTADDAIAIAQALGNAAVAIDPKVEGAVVLITGLATLVRNTIIPAIQHLSDTDISVVEQSALAAESAAERARVGAPPAPLN